jgi:ribonuclease T2
MPVPVTSAAVVKEVQNVVGNLVYKSPPSSVLVDPAIPSPSSIVHAMASSVPSLRSLSKLAFGLVGAGQSVLGFGNSEIGRSLQACTSPQLSCQNTTVVENMCCFNAPGGQLLLTQFWDTNPVTGPVDSWTIHGLWPDHCDGTFDASCDSTRNYQNITSIISSFGKTELLSYMQTYWKDYNGDDESFWQHEWGKHGTCIRYDSHRSLDICYSKLTEYTAP